MDIKLNDGITLSLEPRRNDPYNPRINPQDALPKIIRLIESRKQHCLLNLMKNFNYLNNVNDYHIDWHTGHFNVPVYNVMADYLKDPQPLNPSNPDHKMIALQALRQLWAEKSVVDDYIFNYLSEFLLVS